MSDKNTQTRNLIKTHIVCQWEFEQAVERPDKKNYIHVNIINERRQHLFTINFRVPVRKVGV